MAPLYFQFTVNLGRKAVLKQTNEHAACIARGENFATERRDAAGANEPASDSRAGPPNVGQSQSGAVELPSGGKRPGGGLRDLLDRYSRGRQSAGSSTIMNEMPSLLRRLDSPNQICPGTRLVPAALDETLFNPLQIQRRPQTRMYLSYLKILHKQISAMDVELAVELGPWKTRVSAHWARTQISGTLCGKLRLLFLSSKPCHLHVTVVSISCRLCDYLCTYKANAL